MTCDARIRPFRMIRDDEIACEADGPHRIHTGIARNYAYQGSKTTISWDDEDRRCFHGEWPGDCQRLAPVHCLLPAGHRGADAV